MNSPTGSESDLSDEDEHFYGDGLPTTGAMADGRSDSKKEGFVSSTKWPQAMDSSGDRSEPKLDENNFKTLTDWIAVNDPEKLTEQMFSQREWMRKILCQPDISCQLVNLFAFSFQKIVQKNNRTLHRIVAHVMEVVAHSNFIDIHINSFLSKIHENTNLLPQIHRSIQAFLDILDYIAIRFSDCSHQCYMCCCKIIEFGERWNVVREGNNLNDQCIQLKMKSCPIPLTEGAATFDLTQRVRRERPVPHADEENPPDDFNEKSIFPEIEELETSTEPFLRANKTSGAYRDLGHYTDVHFRLLREDYLCPLRRGISSFMQFDQDPSLFKSDDARFYFDAKLVKMKLNLSDGLHFLIKFHSEVLELQDVNWEFSKRFLFGSLLCFSKDNFQTVIFATVINREPQKLEGGLLEVIFQSNLDQVLTSSEHDTFIIAETVAFFESYKHVLEGLKEVRNLPLEDYILYCEPNPEPPEYLTHKKKYNIGSLMTDEDVKYIDILEPDDWPEFTDTVMNAAQLEAVKLALTNEIAIIQGPPGTGKTYTGLHIMQVLLNNYHITQNEKRQSPILVVCYTNHALDQFLEGILEFCEGGIIRVGGRSKSDKLKNFNLKELRKNPLMDKRMKSSILLDLKNCNRQFKKVNFMIRKVYQELQSLDTDIQRAEDLEEEMTASQQMSLTDRQRSEGNGKEVNIWLKANNANFESHLMKAAEKHLTRLILADTESLPDSYLLTYENTRVKFEVRMKIYRSWINDYKVEKQERLSKLFEQQKVQEENQKPIEHCLESLEKLDIDILDDEDICCYMSDEVFDKIKLCVQQESKQDIQESFVKCWLFGCLPTVDDYLEEIEKLAQLGSKMRTSNPLDEPKTHKQTAFIAGEDRVIIDDEDDVYDNEEEDDGMMAGFQDRFDDDDNDDGNDKDDDDSLSNDSESSRMMNKFKNLSVNFKEKEKREDILLQRAKMLGIDLSDKDVQENETGEQWQNMNMMNYSEVFSLIRHVKVFTDEEVEEIDDVWSLPLRKRYSLYKSWVEKKKNKLAAEMIELTHAFDQLLKKKKRALSRKDIAILKQGRIIGMTTTGAARYRAMLQAVRPEIIIVEEAAEVLEAHIVTTLNANCQHLILIGDHQQLRPNPTVYDLAVHYKLEISLFERLVKNNMRHVTLQIQHRMRPQISKYLHSIYPKLRDHPTVREYGNVSGVGSNVYFLTHNYREHDMFDTKSKENIHEAVFLAKLCKYFLQQGYTGNQITILAAYSGQVGVIKECMEPEETLYEHVRVTSIDNYQGEENDIILLSLVRSNLQQEVGFLKVSNRVCVALSRARQGLFVIGNLDMLHVKSKLWEKILEKARKNFETGVALKLVCRNHRNRESYVQHAEDFALRAPEGGCDHPCDFELFCGHACPRMCHVSDPLHQEVLCYEPCKTICPKGHHCNKKCHEECGSCERMVEKTIPLCGHVDYVQCFLDPKEAVCKQPCGVQLECGHNCSGFCGECRIKDLHTECTELVEKTWSQCGDKSTVQCCTDTRLIPCPAKCRTKLVCGDLCKATCGECLTRRVHKMCVAKCRMSLPCGHQCQAKCSSLCQPCSLRCVTLCRHTKCTKTTCGEICDVCLENCSLGCRHVKCFDKCVDKCNDPPCSKPCPMLTTCKHRCDSICGENCVCYKCEKQNFRLIDFSRSMPGKVVFADKERARKFQIDENTIMMKIPRCNHIFTVSQLDKHVNSFDSKSTSFIRCPVNDCKETVQGIRRYDKLNKSRSFFREEKKQKLLEYNVASEDSIENVRFSLEIVKKFCLFDLDYHMKHKINFVVTKEHVGALRMHARFAYVLFKITDLYKQFNDTPLNVERWKKSMYTQQTRLTKQYKEEMALELNRLLYLIQMGVCRSLIDKEENLSLTGDLKTKHKLLRKSLIQKLNLDTKMEAETFVAELYGVLNSEGVSTYTKVVVNEISTTAKMAVRILETDESEELGDILESLNIPPKQIGMSEQSDTDTSSGSCSDSESYADTEESDSDSESESEENGRRHQSNSISSSQSNGSTEQQARVRDARICV